MNKKSVNNFFIDLQEKKLKELKERLEKELASFAQKDKNLKDNWESKFPSFDAMESGNDQLEIAQDEVEEYLSRLPLEHVLEIRLRDVKLALEKIKSKKNYGICEKCRGKISQERMKIYPDARICLKCQRGIKKQKV